MGLGQLTSTLQFFLYGKRHFTATGWSRASAKYDHSSLEVLDLTSKCYVVTGANSGCGFKISEFLAERGAKVYMVCRNQERAQEAQQRIVEKSGNSKVFTLIADVGLASSVRELQRSLAEKESSIDALVCNAGALLDKRTLTKEGVEVTFASHLLNGAYLLAKGCIPLLQASGAPRVIFVSSGGMYNTAFPGWDVASASDPSQKFDGQLAYAYAKRGQVLLAERMALAYPDVPIVSCHPGWVDTPGVDAAYGSGKSILRPMRSLWEGVEGIVWLCTAGSQQLESGAFYLDRSPQPKHLGWGWLSSFTKNSPAEVDDMMTRLEAATTTIE